MREREGEREREEKIGNPVLLSNEFSEVPPKKSIKAT